MIAIYFGVTTVAGGCVYLLLWCSIKCAIKGSDVEKALNETKQFVIGHDEEYGLKEEDIGNVGEVLRESEEEVEMMDIETKEQFVDDSDAST